MIMSIAWFCLCLYIKARGLRYGRRTMIGEGGWDAKSGGISASEAIGHGSRTVWTIDILSAGEGSGRKLDAHYGKE